MRSKQRVLGLLAVVAGILNHPAESATDPESIVQAQLAAYNARDLGAFLATYAEDAQLFEHPSQLLASGVAQMRERYAARFAGGPGAQEAIAIYEVQETLISRVWFVFGAKTLDAQGGEDDGQRTGGT